MSTLLTPNRYLNGHVELKPEEVGKMSRREPIVAGPFSLKLPSIRLHDSLHESLSCNYVYAQCVCPNFTTVDCWNSSSSLRHTTILDKALNQDSSGEIDEK